MIIYQVYTTDDTAETDTFVETFRAARLHARECGATGPIHLKDGRWSGSVGPDYGVYEVVIEAHNVIPTRQGICSALKWIPNR